MRLEKTFPTRFRDADVIARILVHFRPDDSATMDVTFTRPDGSPHALESPPTLEELTVLARQAAALSRQELDGN